MDTFDKIGNDKEVNLNNKGYNNCYSRQITEINLSEWDKKFKNEKKEIYNKRNTENFFDKVENDSSFMNTTSKQQQNKSNTSGNTNENNSSNSIIHKNEKKIDEKIDNKYSTIHDIMSCDYEIEFNKEIILNAIQKKKEIENKKDNYSFDISKNIINEIKRTSEKKKRTGSYNKNISLKINSNNNNNIKLNSNKTFSSSRTLTSENNSRQNTYNNCLTFANISKENSFSKKKKINNTKNIKKNQCIHKIIYSDLNTKNKSISKDSNKKQRACSFSKLTDTITKNIFSSSKKTNLNNSSSKKSINQNNSFNKSKPISLNLYINEEKNKITKKKNNNIKDINHHTIDVTSNNHKTFIKKNMLIPKLKKNTISKLSNLESNKKEKSKKITQHFSHEKNNYSQNNISNISSNISKEKKKNKLKADKTISIITNNISNKKNENKNDNIKLFKKPKTGRETLKVIKNFSSYHKIKNINSENKENINKNSSKKIIDKKNNHSITEQTKEKKIENKIQNSIKFNKLEILPGDSDFGINSSCDSI